MLRQALLLAVLWAIASRAAAGPECFSCGPTLDGQADCNANAVNITCKDDEICTSDVKCMTKFFKTWEKGCRRERQVEVLDQITCNPKGNRCEFHCTTGDYCNVQAPEELATLLLKCNIEPPTTVTPIFGPDCYSCPQTFGETDQDCLQASGGAIVQCRYNEVCTTDAHCDGKEKKWFEKRCKRRRQIEDGDFNRVVCNAKFNRCQYHCDTGDLCNEAAPAGLWEDLKCNPVPVTTVTPPPGPICYSCTRVYGSEALCLDEATTIQCKNDEVCTTDVHCDTKEFCYYDKGCKRIRQIADGDFNTVVCNAKRNRCQFHCDGGSFCNQFAPPETWESLKCCKPAPPNTPIPPPLVTGMGGIVTIPQTEPPAVPTGMPMPPPTPPAVPPPAPPPAVPPPAPPPAVPPPPTPPAVPPPAPPPAVPPTAPPTPPDGVCTPLMTNVGNGACSCTCECDDPVCPQP